MACHDDSTKNIIEIVIIIITCTRVVKIPVLKTKSWMAIGPLGRQSECRAKA